MAMAPLLATGDLEIKLRRFDHVQVGIISDMSRIVSFLRRALRPVMSTVTEKNITSFASIDDVVFVAYLLRPDPNLKDRFWTVAEQRHDQFSFGMSVAARVPQSVIVCYNNLDDMQHTAHEEELATVDQLDKFIEKCSLPLIPELTRRNEAQYTSVSTQ